MARPGHPTDLQIYHPEELRLRQLAAYYEVLSVAPGLSADLERLYAIIAAPLPMEVGTRRITEFCDRWRLPSGRGARDVVWSLAFTEVVREEMPWHPFQLEVRPTSSPKPSILDLARALSDPQPGETWSQVFKRAAGELRAELKRHAPRRVPPRHHDHDELLRMAQRLYRRAVQKLRWEQIAEVERDEQGTYADWRSVQSTVLDWARTLDVPLPEMRGRPRKRT